MRRNNIFLFLFIFLVACSGNSSLSSFSSRKYTKGYFFDAPAEKPVVSSKAGMDAKPTLLPKKIEQSLVLFEHVQKPTKPSVSFKEPVLSKSVNKTNVITISPMAKDKVEYTAVEKLFDDKPGTDKKEGYDWGENGFLFIAFGLLGMVVFFTLTIVFAVGGVSSSGTRTLAITFLCIALAGLLSVVAGFVMCIIALTHKETSFDTILGLIVSAIVILLLTLSQFHAL